MKIKRRFVRINRRFIFINRRFFKKVAISHRKNTTFSRTNQQFGISKKRSRKT